MSKEILIITGAVIAIGKMQSGVSKKGDPWTSQEIVIKPEGKWAKPAAFRKYKPERDLSEEYALKDYIEVKFNIASREYEGRYYTNLDAWAINKLTNSKEELKFEGDKPPPEAVNEDDQLPF
jgi:hypothetical protein